MLSFLQGPRAIFSEGSLAANLKMALQMKFHFQGRERLAKGTDLDEHDDHDLLAVPHLATLT